MGATQHISWASRAMIGACSKGRCLNWFIHNPCMWLKTCSHMFSKRGIKVDWASHNRQYKFAFRAVKMHGQTSSNNTHIRKLLTRKVKTSMMHIFDMVKARVSQKAKKASAKNTQLHSGSQAGQNNNMKAPLTRKLTQEQINEAELALKRLQAEKRRLEDLLNCASDKHLASQRSYSNSCEDVSNNNVRKELVRVPRYQQKVAFMLHNVFTAEVSTNINTTSLSSHKFYQFITPTGAQVKLGFPKSLSPMLSQSNSYSAWPNQRKTSTILASSQNLI